MGMRDIYNKAKIDHLISPQTETGDNPIVSSIIDCKGFDAVLLALVTGTMSDSNCTSTVLLEESDDSGMSGAAAVDDNDLLGTEALAALTFASDSTTKKLGYRGRKRYIRMTITPSGNTGNFIVAGVAIKMKAHAEPTA